MFSITGLLHGSGITGLLHGSGITGLLHGPAIRVWHYRLAAQV